AGPRRGSGRRDAGDHRGVAGHRRGARARRAGAAAAEGLRPGDRRFRHRLLVAGAAVADPVHRTQDRPGLRIGRQRGAAQARGGRGQPGPGAQAAPGSGGRRRGNGRGLADAGRDGLRHGPGLLDRRSGARRRTHRSGGALAAPRALIPAMRWRLRMRSIRGQLLALFAVLLLAGAAVLVLDEVAQYRARQSLESLQAESLGRLRALKAVDDGYKLGVVDVTFKVRNYLLDWDDGVAALDRARESIDANWRKLRDMPHLPRQEALVLEAAQARERADHAADTLRAILLKQDIGELGRFADTELYPAVDPVSERLQALSDLAMVDAEATVRADVRRAWYTSALRIGLSLLAFLVAAIAGRRILSNAYRGIEALTRLAQRMREHDYVAPPGPRPRGELGEVMDAFLDMRADVLRFETELTEQLVRNEKVREELERATLAKSAFLASMSHEIRTPMIGVTGMVEVLAHTRLDTEQRRALNIIQSSSQSLLQIIGDILDFSKIEAERMELHPVPTRLPRVLQAAVANFS